MAEGLLSRVKEWTSKINILSSQQQLRISMLGPSGVGKTSLLATINYELQRVTSAQTNLQLMPLESAGERLNRKMLKLQSLFLGSDLRVDMGMGIEGDRNVTAYNFALGKKGKSATLQLQFVDYPGGYLESGASAEERAFVTRLLKDSDAIMIPIDAPALMERNGNWHCSRNLPQFIHQLFMETYSDLKAPRLVILTPMRCELYLRDPQWRTEMINEVKKGYTEVLGFLDGLADKVAVVIAPVQTLGEIEFYGMDSRVEKQYAPIFTKIGPDAKYSPVDSEQPLRYLMRFVMRLHLDKRQSSYFNFVRQLFKSDHELIDATTSFAKGCKDSGEFAILQGDEWLDLRR